MRDRDVFSLSLFMLYNFILQDDKEFSKIKTEIVNSVLAKLKKIYGGAGKPGTELEIIVLLDKEQDALFR